MMINFLKNFFKANGTDNKFSYKNYYEENVNMKLEIATEISNKEFLTELYECLFTKDINNFKKALKLIMEIINELKIEDYKYLDSYFRNKSSIKYNIEWKEMDSQLFIKDFMNEREKIVIYGLSTFHPNGYFREKNLIELLKYNTGEELKYLFLRTNDWVYKIGELAEKEVIKRLEISNISEVIKILPLVYRAKNWGKCDIDIIENKINELFKSCNNIDLILTQVKSNNFFIKKLCYRTLIEINYDSTSLLDCATKETSPELRYLIYKSLLKRGENIEAYLEKDKYYKIRLEWLKIIETKDILKNREKLIEKLFDKNEFIREATRNILSKSTKIDFREFYKQNLNIRIKESLMGIYDLAIESDKEIFEKYIDHNNISIRIIALKGLAKTNFYEHKDLFLSSLESNDKVISLQSLKILDKNIFQINDEIIYKIYINNTNDFTKENCVRLLIKTKKWVALKYILEFLNSDNPKIKELAEFRLDRWIRYFNSGYSKFSENLEDYIKLINNSTQIDEKTKKWLLFSLK